MSTRERAVDRGTSKGAYLLISVGREIRLARRNLGLSLRQVAGHAGLSVAELARIERAQAPWTGVLTLARVSAVVGLDLSVRAYPGGRPIREARHVRMLAVLRSRSHPSLSWKLEVGLPHAGDQRGWDAVIGGSDWRYGVEVELNPLDGQALLRRISLKRRDGDVDGVLLVLPDTRQVRAFRREYLALIVEDFPVSSREALARLGVGEDPRGSALIVLE